VHSPRANTSSVAATGAASSVAAATPMTVENTANTPAPEAPTTVITSQKPKKVVIVKNKQLKKSAGTVDDSNKKKRKVCADPVTMNSASSHSDGDASSSNIGSSESEPPLVGAGFMGKNTHSMMLMSACCDVTSEESRTNTGLPSSAHAHAHSPMRVRKAHTEQQQYHQQQSANTQTHQSTHTSLNGANGLSATTMMLHVPTHTYNYYNTQSIESPIKKRARVAGKRRITPTFVAPLTQRALFLPPQQQQANNTVSVATTPR
jgi:hypothetical protein